MKRRNGYTLFTKIIYNPNDEDLRYAARLLEDGGLAAFPTETVYGLGANGLNSEAVKNIFTAKGRPSDNPLILHLAYAEQAEEYAYTCPLFYKLALAFMPGPLTVILKKKPCVPDEVTCGLPTVALRVPSHKIAHRLLEHCRFPVAAPSANLSGRPSPTNVEHVIDDLNGKVDMILDGGPCDVGVESTIVMIEKEDLTLLRPGAVTPDMLAPFCENLRIDPALEKPLGENVKPLAPGMKYRHYAPKANVILLDGDREAVLAFMRDRILREDVGLLLDDAGPFERYGARVLCYGSSPEDEARALFASLREFDRMKNVHTIYAPLPRKEGIGLAVYNRLIKAAGFTVQKVN